MTNILKYIHKPNKTCAIFAPNEIFKTIEETMKEYFLRQGIRSHLETVST